MGQIEAQYKQVDVLPMVKHYINSLDLYNLFKKYVPASTNCLAEHAESLCIITANIICDNKPLYKVQEWLSKYADGLTNESVNADKFNDDRLARSLSALLVTCIKKSASLSKYRVRHIKIYMMDGGYLKVHN